MLTSAAYSEVDGRRYNEGMDRHHLGIADDRSARDVSVRDVDDA